MKLQHCRLCLYCHQSSSGEPELPYHCHGLGTTVGNVSLSTVGDVFLDKGGMGACVLVSDAGDSSLGRSGSQLTHGVSPKCEPTLLQPRKTVHYTADNSLDIYRLSHAYGGHVGEGKTSDSCNSTAC